MKPDTKIISTKMLQSCQSICQNKLAQCYMLPANYVEKRDKTTVNVHVHKCLTVQFSKYCQMC